MKNKYFSAFFICSLIVSAQENKQKIDSLQEVVTSSRIDLPFKENSEPFS
jgi:iron complex outermembrane receptor protein